MVESTLTDVRLCAYRRFLEDGRPPTVVDVSERLELPLEEVESAFRGLEEGHVLVFEPGTLEIWMANPLSARPTGFRVSTESGSWWGTCVWDAFGIPAMLGEDATIATFDPGSGEPFELRIADGELEPVEAVAHFSVPARQWWADIGYSRATMLAFRSEASVERWCEETGNPRGSLFGIDQAHELGRAWYADKLSPAWRRATPAEAEATFARIGLTGDFWRLT